jgi:anti-sigma regulatory factor (Ser/Thr protein kinase)
MHEPNADQTIAVHSRDFPATPEALVGVRAFLRERCREGGVTGTAADDVILSVCEACTNAVMHSGSRTFRVTWQQRGNRVEVRIHDEGRFERAVPDDDRHGGNGLPLMTAVMDEVTVRRGTARRPGTEVRLVKELASTPPVRARRRTRRLLTHR